MFQRIEGKPIEGSLLVYRHNEFSFDTDPKPEVEGFTSLLINELQIELDADGRLLYAWGLLPHTTWKEASLLHPISSPGVVRFADDNLTPGVSIRVNKGARWDVWVDRESGSVCLGDYMKRGDDVIQFGPGCTAVLDAGHLVALWLMPRMTMD